MSDSIINQLLSLLVIGAKKDTKLHRQIGRWEEQIKNAIKASPADELVFIAEEMINDIKREERVVRLIDYDVEQFIVDADGLLQILMALTKTGEAGYIKEWNFAMQEFQSWNSKIGIVIANKEASRTKKPQEKRPNEKKSK